MRKFIAVLCCVIVGLQVLIGVPAAVCLAFFLHLGSDVLGPTTVEFRVANSAELPQRPATADQPSETPARPDAILEARQECGSVLAGTLLGENLNPADEQREFVAAFRQIAGEVPDPAAAPANPLPPLPLLPPLPSIIEPGSDSKCESPRKAADQFAIEQLYALANSDEQAGVFDRADQWRGLARAIRCECQPQACQPNAACDPVVSARCPLPADGE